ncbi:similar to Saccharomyces cerevisiae YNL322C KRE1 Cell wall glycoprotein involved in beta-glucan assembly [Maudiozyma saulgeensis]|uniref:Similar to Saccharomyces cerevisiae YNL322C KRE1 Cell wall glycoprotein involved in beta-glucan assembly n=1 Tax=Maudiozyma saulgeensis TaxID=1789683 RepID=A0A1X7R1D0_9SACH|nr:similar to Saccharomyces cerevisiae YNL322C KRE1 Cell wall glycoprotein involved in beta-glucan assembly [Kazachstania saulgeensis]
MLISKLSVSLLLLPFTLAALTTQLITTTNIAGATVTRSSIYDNAATIVTDANGVIQTVTTTTGAATAATATAATATGVTTSVYTSTDLNGVIMTRTTTLNAGSLTSSSSSVTGTAGTAVTTGMTTRTYTSTDPNGVTLTRTTTYALNSATTDAAAAAAATDTSSTSTTQTTTGSYINNGRPDPSTSMTPYPLTAVTTLSLDSFYTVTQGTTKTYTSLRAHTTIYATVVISGQTIVRSTTFAQRFSSQYTAVAVPSSGSIGLGSLTGTIGVVKTNMKTTIKYNNGSSLNPGFTTLFGLFTLFISCLI